MSTTREEATASIGIDHSTVARSLNALEGTVKGFGHRLTHQFKELGAGLLAGFGLMEITSKMKEAVEQVAQLSNRAHGLKISASFLEDLESVGKASNKSQESIEKMISTFAKSLPAGSNVEEAFYKIIDNLNALPDSAERSREAFRAFGRSSADLLDIASQGSEAFKEMAASLSKYSKDEIKSIREADEALSHLGNTFTKLAGKSAAALTDMSERVARWFQAIKNMYRQGADESAGGWLARLFVMNDDDIQNEFERLGRQQQMEEKLAEQRRAGKTISLEQSEAISKQLETLKAIVAAKEVEQEMDRVKLIAAREISNIQDRQFDKFKPTLDELSRHGIFSGAARGIERLDRRIKRDFERGNTDQAGADIAQRNRLFDSLVDRGVLAERDEPRLIREIQARTEQHLADIARGKVAVLVKAQLSE